MMQKVQVLTSPKQNIFLLVLPYLRNGDNRKDTVSHNRPNNKVDFPHLTDTNKMTNIFQGSFQALVISFYFKQLF